MAQSAIVPLRPIASWPACLLASVVAPNCAPPDLASVAAWVRAPRLAALDKVPLRAAVATSCGITHAARHMLTATRFAGAPAQQLRRSLASARGLLTANSGEAQVRVCWNGSLGACNTDQLSGGVDTVMSGSECLSGCAPAHCNLNCQQCHERRMLQSVKAVGIVCSAVPYPGTRVQYRIPGLEYSGTVVP